MPSPFPGMDPYLENPILWPGVHQSLITFIRGALNRVLPEMYVADIGERVYIVEPRRNIYPDVAVFQRPGLHRGGAGAAVLDRSAPVWVVKAAPAEVREVFVRILPAGDFKNVITVIEVLSPSNKTAGNPGRELYVQKQKEILQSGTHMVEIDLLRSGEHTVSAPLQMLRQMGDWDYIVCRHLSGTGDHYEAWPILLRDRLPWIRIPLGEDHPDIELDLQPLFDRAYDEGAYPRVVDYHRDPAVHLSAVDSAWAGVLLRAQGLRE